MQIILKRQRRTILRLLTGIARCGEPDCGLPARAASPHPKQPYYRYRCPNMQHFHRRVEPIDEFVVGHLLDRLSTNKFRECCSNGIVLTPVDFAGEVEGIRQELDELADAYATNELSLRKMTDRTMALNVKLAEIRRTASAAPRSSFLCQLITRLDDETAWRAMNLQDQRLVVDSLLSIEVLGQGKGSQIFNPASVRIRWRI